MKRLGIIAVCMSLACCSAVAMEKNDAVIYESQLEEAVAAAIKKIEEGVNDYALTPGEDHRLGNHCVKITSLLLDKVERMAKDFSLDFNRLEYTFFHNDNVVNLSKCLEQLKKLQIKHQELRELKKDNRKILEIIK